MGQLLKVRKISCSHQKPQIHSPSNRIRLTNLNRKKRTFKYKYRTSIPRTGMQQFLTRSQPRKKDRIRKKQNWNQKSLLNLVHRTNKRQALHNRHSSQSILRSRSPVQAKMLNQQILIQLALLSLNLLSQIRSNQSRSLP